MLDVHNDSAPSNIMKLFARTSNIRTYILLTHQRYQTEDSYMEPDETMLKFKYSKIEPNWTSSTICIVHFKTLELFLLYNEHL